jgi:hypothetical protein
MQAVPNGRVGKIEFLLHTVDFPLTADECENKIQMFGG